MKIVFLTGAGMSAESGLSTFRDADGLWNNYPVQQVASHEGWEADPDLVTEFYNGLRSQLIKAQPCEGHRLIAGLQERHKVVVVTQNVDNLHERAGSRSVIHLHGELMKVCSSRDVDNPRYQETLSAERPRVEPGTKAGDGSLLRPFIVFFGESVPRLYDAIAEVETADMLVIIGTSLAVYPAASLVRYTRRGTPIRLIDPKPVQVDPSLGVVQYQTGASEGMRKMLEELD